MPLWALQTSSNSKDMDYEQNAVPVQSPEPILDMVLLSSVKTGEKCFKIEWSFSGPQPQQGGAEPEYPKRQMQLPESTNMQLRTPRFCSFASSVWERSAQDAKSSRRMLLRSWED